MTEVEISGRTITPGRYPSPRTQNSKIPSKSEIPEIKETSTKIHRLRQLLPQLQPALVRKITWIFRTFEGRHANQSNRKVA